MPMDRKLYPDNWEEIATKVKDEASWHCEECNRPCRRTGVDWDDFTAWLLIDVKKRWYEQTYEEVHDDETGEWGSVPKPQRFTLTVAHLNHIPADCDRSNLRALCSGCHLRYDNQFKPLKRQLKQEQQGQLSLLEEA